jgi:hypothetical protein
MDQAMVVGATITSGVEETSLPKTTLGQTTFIYSFKFWIRLFVYADSPI